MTVKNIIRIRIILLATLICTSMISCNDIIESNFSNYKKAMDVNYFDKGWIPEELANKEMKNIFVKNDLDKNTCIFSYHLPSVELEKLEKNLIRLEQNYTERMNINNSKWFEKELLNLPKYYSNDYKHRLAINKEKRKVYGWLN